MAQAGEISILVSVDSKGVKKGIRSSSNQLKKGAKELNKNARAWAKWGAASATAAAAVATAIVRTQLKTIDALAKTSDRLGLATEELQGLRNAAEQTGVAQNSLDMALQRMTRRISEAAQGSGEAVNALKELNLEASELAKMTPDQAMRRVADAMQDVESQSDKVRLAFKLFDSEGVGLVNTLRGGSEALDDYTDEVRDLGAAITRVDAAQIEAANDAISRASMAVSGIFQQLALQASPVITAIADNFSALAKESGGFGDEVADIMDAVVVGGINVASVFRGVVGGIKETIEDVWSGFKALPPWAQEVGVLGALMGGRKGIAALALFSKAADDTKATAAWFAALTEGDIGFAEWMAAGPDEARKRLKELGHDIDAMSERAQGPSIIGTLFGDSEGSEAEEWAAGWIQRYRDTVAGARAAAEEAARESGISPIDVAANDEGGQKYSPEENEKFLEGLRERFASERELIDMNLETELERLREAREQELLTEQDFQNRKTQLLDRAAKDTADIAKKEAQARIQTMSAMMGNLANLMNTGSRKMFEIGKAAAIAQAVVDGYAAVVGAYKVGASQGGPWLGAAYAATAAATTAAQIQRISSSSFSGGAGGGTASFSGGVPVQNTAPAQQQQQGGQGESRNVSISLTGTTFSPESVRELIREINEQVGDGVNIMAA